MRNPFWGLLLWNKALFCLDSIIASSTLFIKADYLFAYPFSNTTFFVAYMKIFIWNHILQCFFVIILQTVCGLFSLTKIIENSDTVSVIIANNLYNIQCPQAIPREFRKTLDANAIYKINFIFSVGTTYMFLTHENSLCARACKCVLSWIS